MNLLDLQRCGKPVSVPSNQVHIDTIALRPDEDPVSQTAAPVWSLVFMHAWIAGLILRAIFGAAYTKKKANTIGTISIRLSRVSAGFMRQHLINSLI